MASSVPTSVTDSDLGLEEPTTRAPEPLLDSPNGEHVVHQRSSPSKPSSKRFMSDTYPILNRCGSKIQPGEILSFVRCVNPNIGSIQVAVKCITLLPTVTARHEGQALPDDPHQEQCAADSLKAHGDQDSVVNCYESFVEQDRLVLVMRYCPDGDLYTRIQLLATQALSEPDVLAFSPQILLGAHFLRCAGSKEWGAVGRWARSRRFALLTDNF